MNAVKDQAFRDKMRFYNNAWYFRSLVESLNKEYNKILLEGFRGNRFSISHFPNEMRIGDFTLTELDVDKSRDESRIFVYKNKFVVKLRIIPKLESKDFRYLIYHMNVLERKFYNIDQDLYYVLKVRDQQNVNKDIQRRLNTKEIYFICTYYRGVSLENLRKNFFLSDYPKESKIQVAKTIMLRLCRLLIISDECMIYLADMEIRNFGFSIDNLLSVLDEEMIHYEENPVKRRKYLNYLMHEICQKTFEGIMVEAINFKDQMISCLDQFWTGAKTRDEIWEHIEVLVKSVIGCSIKRKRGSEQHNSKRQKT